MMEAPSPPCFQLPPCRRGGTISRNHRLVGAHSGVPCLLSNRPDPAHTSETQRIEWRRTLVGAHGVRPCLRHAGSLPETVFRGARAHGVRPYDAWQGGPGVRASGNVLIRRDQPIEARVPVGAHGGAPGRRPRWFVLAGRFQVRSDWCAAIAGAGHTAVCPYGSLPGLWVRRGCQPDMATMPRRQLVSLSRSMKKPLWAQMNSAAAVPGLGHGGRDAGVSGGEGA